MKFYIWNHTKNTTSTRWEVGILSGLSKVGFVENHGLRQGEDNTKNILPIILGMKSLLIYDLYFFESTAFSVTI